MSSSTFKEFLDVCVCLEEAELQKLLGKKIACARKEHDNDGKGKRQDRSKLHHERHHSLGKHHQGKQKKKLCDFSNFFEILIEFTMIIGWSESVICNAPSWWKDDKVSDGNARFL